MLKRRRRLFKNKIKIVRFTISFYEVRVMIVGQNAIFWMKRTYSSMAADIYINTMYTCKLGC